MKKIKVVVFLLLFIFILGQLCMAEETDRKAGDTTIFASFKTGHFTPADETTRPNAFWTYGFELEGDVVLHKRLSVSGKYYYLTGNDSNFSPAGDFRIHNLDGKFNILLTKEKCSFPVNFWVGVKHLRVIDNTTTYGDDKASFSGVGFGVEKRPNLNKKFDVNLRFGYYPVLKNSDENIDLSALDLELGGNFKIKDNISINTSYFYERWSSDVKNQFLQPVYGVTVGNGVSKLQGLRFGINFKF